MSQVSQRSMTQHFVSLNKFDTSIERVMSTLWAALGPTVNQRMFPTLIGLEIDFDGTTDDVGVLRSFLRKLRKVSQTHFVRFVTDTLWAAESDNVDVFYTHDEAKDDWCDVMWTIKFTRAKQIELTSVLSVDQDRHIFLNNLANNVKKFIPFEKADTVEVAIARTVRRFYTSVKDIDIVHQLDENLHIFLIPNMCQSGFYPIILYGMSYDDAFRKGRRLMSELDYHANTKYEIFTDAPCLGGMFNRTLDMIQETEKFGFNLKEAKDTYALTESIFGLYAYKSRLEESKHDLIVINQFGDRRNDVNTYHYSLAYLSQAL